MDKETVATYRLHAAHCFEVAQHSDDPAQRHALLSMAQAWLALAKHTERLAEDIEKMSGAVLVEPPQTQKS